MNTETGAVGTRRNIYQNCTVFQMTSSLWLQDPAKKPINKESSTPKHSAFAIGVEKCSRV